MKTIISMTLCCLLTGSLMAQGNDSLIVRAMQDELDRNMSELRYEGFEKPFYIAYSIEDRQQYSMIAVMGSLLRSTHERVRAKGVRVLVGSYDFNDESLDSDSYSPPEANEIEMPLDDDYFGIRRSLWVTTDYIYKSAARQYKQNLELLEQKKKTITEMPHRSFAKKPANRIMAKLPPYPVDVEALQNYVKVLSREFGAYPAIEHSSVFVSYQEGHTYFLNSEGTVAITPARWATVHLYAMRKTPEGETIQEQITHDVVTPEQLPSVQAMKQDIKRLCTFIGSTPIARFEDEYKGPVLIIGKPVADLLARTLFQSKDALIASNALPDPRGFRSSEQSSIDTRIDKTVVPANITVRSVPFMTSFEGTPLLGSSLIDDEGVVPQAETVIIEKGILKTLLNDRSIIKQHETANGHSSGPGVIDIQIENGTTIAELKNVLIDQARKDGQEYALMLIENSDVVGGLYAIRITLADGREEMLRAPVTGFLELRELRDVAGVSGTRKAYNLPFGGQKLTSFIVPEAVLLKEFEVNSESVTYFKDEQFISNPLRQ